MKTIQFSKLLLAFLVILSFALVGVAIAFRSFWLSTLFILLGFGFMGYGIALKRKNPAQN